jgi:hypothetical protein
MASSIQLRALQEKFDSNQNPSDIESKSTKIRSLISEIVSIISSEKPNTNELNTKLDELSHFFRLEKFSTVVLPVLSIMAQKDTEEWEKAKHPERNERIKVIDFENFPKSTALVQDEHGNIESEFVRIRELVLLGIYGITQDAIGEAFLRTIRNR